MSDVQQAETPSTAEFRKLMGLFTTGVCVVSVEAGEHGVAGMTVNSFVSVSLEPLLISWSLHNSSSQFDLFAKADRFAISILSEGQNELALRYAARGDSLLNTEDFVRSAQGLPVVEGAIAHLECRNWSEFVAGDHTMIFGEVTGLSPHTDETDARSPLGFFNGQFCSIGGS